LNENATFGCGGGVEGPEYNIPIEPLRLSSPLELIKSPRATHIGNRSSPQTIKKHNLDAKGAVGTEKKSRVAVSG